MVNSFFIVNKNHYCSKEHTSNEQSSLLACKNTLPHRSVRDRNQAEMSEVPFSMLEINHSVNAANLQSLRLDELGFGGFTPVCI